MRARAFAVGAVLLLLLAGTASALAASGLALPWRGSLARYYWRALGDGWAARLECDFWTMPPVSAGAARSASPSLPSADLSVTALLRGAGAPRGFLDRRGMGRAVTHCQGGDERDRMSLVAVGGFVIQFDRRWSVDSAGGRESFERAVAEEERRYGPGRRCTGFFSDVPYVRVAWERPFYTVVVEGSDGSGSPAQAGPQARGWSISLSVHRDNIGCPRDPP